MEKNKRYIERKRLYSGHYSDIYACKDTLLNTPVCLKIVDEDIRLKPHDVRYEIKLLDRVRGDAIVPLLDHYHYIDDIVLVMPLYEYTLDQLLAAKHSRKRIQFNLTDPLANGSVIRNQLELADGIKFCRQLASALAHIHAKGVIHRDIKPSNIFFLARPDGRMIEHPVLGDFGISYDAEVCVDEDAKHKYTDVCSGIYKPPQLCLGVVNYGPEVDVWSFGVVMTILFLNNLKSCLEDDLDEEARVNDLALLNSIFKTFGTPYVEPATESDPLYWREMDNDDYYFKNFEFTTRRQGRPIGEILPRADDRVKQVFGRMMMYESSQRATLAELAELFG